MIGWLAVVVCALPGVVSAAAGVPVLEGLRPEIDFWKAIFANYSSEQVVFHDRDDLTRIYSALDFSGLAEAGLSDLQIEIRRREAVQQEAERLRALLLDLHRRGGDTTGLSKEELRIARLFGENPAPDAFLEAAGEGRVRGQTGLRDRFQRGLEISRRYLPMMEKIFGSEGLPIELTRLPFVESAFNVKAYSKVGAAGLWQFMPSTGRLYMTVGNVVDERRDPIASTVAAARFLKSNYDHLGSWPLAVTAYNHGRGGVARAVGEVGSTDLVKIVRRYRGPSFGFASRNFYAEFLAAVEVERDAERYFGPINGERELHIETVTVPVSTSFAGLARAAGVDRDMLAELNPALSSHALAGRVPVPSGYRLRLPSGSSGHFAQSTSTLVAMRTEKKSKKVSRSKGSTSAAKGGFVRHRVRRGQTLQSIARQYQTTVNRIRRHNRLSNPNIVPVGQTLVIPRG
ncbi:MAG TPA: transglycosylase SLT domain-containing protein [Terriglobales bacterium]|nr:transglycosylase SLT domain-containing protein [Terriglobales bacterium]